MNIEEYKKIVQEQYIILDTHYQNGFVFGGKDKKIEHFKHWVSEIVNKKIPSKDLVSFTSFIIKESNSFKNKAPNIAQYIDAYSEWKKNKEYDSNPKDKSQSFEDCFNEIYKSLAIRYERLWAANQVGNMDSHKNFWKKELSIFKDKPEILLKAYCKIRKLNDYKQYPPNIDQFIDIANLVSFSDDIPTSEEAYIQAITFKDPKELHPVVRYTRSKFGYSTLINQNNKNIKAVFFCEYSKNIDLILSGKLVVSELSFDDGEIQDEQLPIASKEKTISEIDNILNSLK